MTHTDRATIMVADYDFGDVDIERAIAEKAGFELQAYRCKTEEELIRYGRDADAILTQYVQISAAAMDQLPKCRVIARYGTGVDTVDVDAATRHGIQVTNAPNDWCAEEVADHAIALWLAAARKINEYDAAIRAGSWTWQTGEPIWRLSGQVFGILGFGAIAQLIADRARPFGVRLIAHDPFVPDDRVRAHSVEPVSFDELVETSDFLTIQAPLTADTHHLFDRATLARMQPTAILINTARGPIVEDTALADALTTGTIAGAALDDLEEEPAKHRDWRPDNPLLHLPNTVVTPHAAYYSEQSLRTVRALAAEEAVRVLTGQTPQSPVNTVSR
ncbi:C-terminal binding protein [Dactylosporangium aurantiacum]|uniref:C-terminal binding protein n=1 Tax=Dactylosporangium aurantiacum TaxID=35754 RepID=A0A9Q9I8K3_9ACTN|nr:C-terminal binding protein [Dactylosporangium aurantiacum]MDG6107062.1 C-terminal binding protein [Dactylosporangium aurantiacum]UWZ51362.1 C-terminal binding protein [Dactylosporangium aurantiacum]